MAFEETAPVLPTPPASPSAADRKESSNTGNGSYTETAKALDALLEQYLNLLDRQQSLQEELGKQFSSGFFSLARANHSCPPGRRYGEDYYDERMKALRKISIAPQSSTSDNSTPKKETSTDESSNDVQPPLSFSISHAQAPPSSKRPKEDDASDDDSDETTPSRSTTPEKELPSSPSNPITWFGILVPPVLRLAQSSFISAVEGPIPALASVIGEMREVEEKVRRMRVLLDEEKGE